MAQTKASRAMQAKLKENPLFFLDGEAACKCLRCFIRVGIEKPKLRKVPLYMAWNYGWDTCRDCGYTVNELKRRLADAENVRNAALAERRDAHVEDNYRGRKMF